MRIALLSYEYPPETGFGGIGTYTYHHAHALARLGHEVHVFAGSTQPERRTYRDGAVTVTRFRAGGFLGRLLPGVPRHGLWWFQNRLQTATDAFAAVARHLRDESFDVVEMPECGADGALLTQLIDLPTVVRLHSPAELIMPSYGVRKLDQWLTTLVERLSLSGAKAITSCSRWLAIEVTRRMGIARPIEVIPNGIDLGLFDAAEGVDVRAECGIPAGATAIFFANRLEVRKGIDVVRHLIAELLPAEQGAVLVLAGNDHGGVFANELVPLAREHGVEARLLHIGHHEPAYIRACLKQTDIFLLPSLWENAPFSLLEAMAASRATVASDSGGIAEILRHETDGLVVPTGDGAMFVRALRRLIQDPGLRRRFGESARQRVESRFTSDATARRTAEFYRWAVAPARSAAPAAGGARARAEAPVGPADWHQVWWLRGLGPGASPSIECDGIGHATLAGLPPAELSFVSRVLTASYRLRHGDQHPQEATFLARLDELLRERAVAGDQRPPPRERDIHLGMPDLTHPLFADDALLETFLAELWRLRDWPGLQAWLARVTAYEGFAQRALTSPMLRLLAIEAAVQNRDPETWQRLAAIYRDGRTQPRVVEADRRYVATGNLGAWLQARIGQLGLHAPLRRPRALAISRRRKGAGTSPAATNAVTVIVLALEHDDHLNEAIRSALAQAGTSVERIVIASTGTDRVAATVRSIDDPRLELRPGDPEIGLGASLVAAMARVETEYVALLQSDDLFHPERLAACVATLEQDPAALLAASELTPMDDQARLADPAHASALDVGRPLWDWLLRFEELRAAERPTGDEVAALLRGSHLANCSNIVVRTGFLRGVAPLLQDLDRSAGWLLFLLAADRAGLRVVDRVLLGYRLRERAEIATDGPGRARQALEADLAFVRFASQKLRSSGATDAAATAVRSVAGWIDAALAGREQGGATRTTFAAMLEHAGVPSALAYAPVGVAPLAGRSAIPDWPTGRESAGGDPCAPEAIAAESWIPFARRLAVETDRLRERLARAAEAAEDERTMRDQLDQWQARAARLEQDLVELAHTQQSQLRDTEQRLRASAEAERRELLSVVEREHADATSALRAQHTAQLDELRARVRRLRSESVQAQQHLLDTLEMRFGRFLLDRLRLRKPVQSAQRFARRATLRIDRTLAGLRRKTAPRIGMLVDGRFPLDGTLEAAWEAMALAEAGFDVHVLTWHKFDRRELGSFAGRARVHVHRLAEDPRLARADRSRLRRAGLPVEALDARAAHVAATLRAIRADVVQAHGLGAAAAAAQAAKAVLALPMVLRVTAGDLLVAAGQESSLLGRLREADLITADSGSTASALCSLAGAPLPSLEVRGAILPAPAPEAAPPPPSGAPVLALLDRAASMPALSVLEPALANLRSTSGNETPELIVIGEPATDERALERRETLAGVICRAGLNPAAVFVGPASPQRLQQVAARGVVLLASSPHREDPSWTVAIGGAVAAGMRVLAVANGSPARDQDRRGVYPTVDADAATIVDALRGMARDTEDWAQVVSAAREGSTAAMAQAVQHYSESLRGLLKT